jgi:two-component system, chemotaxis family, protein-glutamate methylesterase/glutaminase
VERANGRNIIVVGASAGGVLALSELVASLPANLPAAVFAVLHVNPHCPSALPAILNRSSALPVLHPKDGEKIQAGRVYVAPPDRHLILQDGQVRLSYGPTENGHRPAIDVLFRTAARAHGARVIGVVLTGSLDDGTAGLAHVKQYGGLAVVQDPEEADYRSMPESALRHVAVDHVLPIAGMGPLLDHLARAPLPEPLPSPPEGDMGKSDLEIEDEQKGVPSGLTCPDCAGALWERSDGNLVHFRCRTGHAFSPESLAAMQAESLESALWAAVRSLEENASLARRLERRLREGGSTSSSTSRFLRRAEVAEQHAARLRELLYKDVADHDPEESLGSG